MIINEFKLRHIDLVISKPIQYMKLLEDMFNYKHTWFNRIFRYKKAFEKIYKYVKYFQQLSPKDLDYMEGSRIKKPSSIDNITFIAMMEINMLFSNEGNSERPIGELMAEVISIVCYSANVNQNFDIDSYSFKKFKKHVENQPAYQMIGLYNWIDKEIRESGKLWTELFFDVEVIDKDYMAAGGDSMKAFNVINSIRSICEDFNVTYKEAWQMTYSVTQTSSLSRATSAFIQDKMSKIKEARMKAQQKKNG